MRIQFGDLLREYRIGAGVSLVILANYLKLSVPYLSDIERNRRGVLTDKRVRSAAEVLDVAPDLLLCYAAHQKQVLNICRFEERPIAQQAMGRLLAVHRDLSDHDWAALQALVDERTNAKAEMEENVVALGIRIDSSEEERNARKRRSPHVSRPRQETTDEASTAPSPARARWDRTAMQT